MSSLFSARRKPKRITHNEPEPEPPTQDTVEENGPVVRRPAGSSVRTKSKLRQAYVPGINDTTEDDVDLPEANSKVSRLGASLAAQRISTHQETRPERAEDRPSYSKAYLDELRNSQASTPLALSSPTPSSSSNPDPHSLSQDLDLATKFGPSSTSAIRPSSIPSTSEIAEKKARRARLALESTATTTNNPHSSLNKSSNPDAAPDFISLEPYDSDGEFAPQRHQSSISTYLDREAIRSESTRLVPDDEDIAEGFDNFTEDAGRVSLSRKALARQEDQSREQIRTLIEEASGDSEESDEEAELNQGYVLGQTRKGLSGLRGERGVDGQALERGRRPRQPREVIPVPRLAEGLERLRGMISAVEFERGKVEVRQAQVGREREECKREMERIQGLLEESGRELEKHLQVERKEVEGRANGSAGGDGRGLESFGQSNDVAGTQGEEDRL